MLASFRLFLGRCSKQQLFLAGADLGHGGDAVLGTNKCRDVRTRELYLLGDLEQPVPECRRKGYHDLGPAPALIERSQTEWPLAVSRIGLVPNAVLAADRKAILLVYCGGTVFIALFPRKPAPFAFISCKCDPVALDLQLDRFALFFRGGVAVVMLRITTVLDFDDRLPDELVGISRVLELFQQP